MLYIVVANALIALAI